MPGLSSLFGFGRKKAAKSLPSSLYALEMMDIDGNMVSLSDYQDKLQELYAKHQDKGFTILAFPCNQFGGQEPGTNEEIKKDAEEKYGVTFPMFAKIEVNGDNESPLYTFLKANSDSWYGVSRIKWNFEKFLVVNGMPVKRYAPTTEPLSIEKDILPYLQ